MNDASPHLHPVLLFDGECGLCQQLVRVLLSLDRSQRIHFAPLQGPSAQAYLLSHHLPTRDFDSLVWVADGLRHREGKPKLRTDGVIAALRACNSPAATVAAACLAIFPRAMRDAGYRVIGRMRYRIFGPWVPRPLPRREWERRYLP